ncbi:glycosyltransferase family 2 protein [Psychrobacillus psychrotolerans]|uniref:glycosyltransferase family 2 protein n=1 Tax=Psychrobacillus psychrotolerans TaxID=126156 RepID=UPI003B022D25
MNAENSKWYKWLPNKERHLRVRKKGSNSSKSNDKVGVVLPVYNQEREYLFECVQAIENQKYRNFELVIVIDGANAQTVKAVYEASKLLTCKYTIIHRIFNKGIAHSLNEGFERLLDCALLTWISSDNIQWPNFLEKLVSTMKNATPDTVLVYSLYHPIDEKRASRDINNTWYPALTEMMKRPKEEIMLTCFIGASFLFTREAYEQADGYDPKYGLVSDYEFWIRLMPLGEFLFLPEPLMDYRLNGKYSLTTITASEELFLQSMSASIDHRRKNGDIPKVTVIITACNHGNYIKNCIQSVLNQTFSSFQVVAIDVGSTDSTLSEIYSIHDSRIIPIHISKRTKAEALNIGLQYVLGEYVLELDGDDWLDPSSLEILVGEMLSLPPNVGLVYANRQVWFEENGGLLEGPIYKGISYKDKYEVLEKFQTHCPRLYRSSTLKELNGWITTIQGEPLLADDFAMFLRIAEDFELHWVDKDLYHQRRHSTNITIKEKEILNNQFRMIAQESLLRWGNVYEANFEVIDGTITKIMLVPTGKEMTQR